MSSEERYDYFIRKVADFEIVWGLNDGGWAILSDNEGNEVFPFWPEKELAEICVQDSWSSYKPKSIELNHFIEKWLTGMEKDGILVGVFYTPEGKGVVVQPAKLKADLEEELEQYD